MDQPSIADAVGHPHRFTDFGVPDAGIRALFSIPNTRQAQLNVEAALALAEQEVGVIPAGMGQLIADACRIEALNTAHIDADMAVQAHPLVPLISELVRVVGEPAGGWVHWGATSQNIMQTAMALVLRQAHTTLRTIVDDCLQALADWAERGADIPMAGRTHGQHAVPITFGFKVAQWIDDLLRVSHRWDDSLHPCLRVMIGGAGGTYASLGERGPLVQAAMGRHLGLAPMAVPSRALLDPLVAYLSDTALLSASFARIAFDVETLMQTEFGELSEPVGEGSVGSSTMPHKRNPKLCNDILELSANIRSQVAIGMASLVHAGEADGRSCAEVDAALERSLVDFGDLVTRSRLVLQGLIIDQDRMAANLQLTGGLIASEAVMLKLAETVGREQAHHVIYDVSMQAAKTKQGFLELLRADPRVHANLDDAQLADLVDPLHHVGLSAQLARDSAERARASLAGRG